MRGCWRDFSLALKPPPPLPSPKRSSGFAQAGRPSPRRGEGGEASLVGRTEMNDATPPAPNRRTLLASMALMAAGGTLPARAGGGAAMKHVGLLGDSVFDNKAYVGGGPG